MSRSLHRLVYDFSWDTRCRNLDARQAISAFGDDATILDAGCGEYGLAAFMPSADITGIDIMDPAIVDPRLNYVHGSILDLPFEPMSFDIAASVDVFEHLPSDVRPDAVRQLVRVARKAVVIAFPCGEFARGIDADFERELSGRKLPLPEWLEDHLRDRYPGTAEMIQEIRSSASAVGRSVKTHIIYSEPAWVSRSLRWAAARSRYVYLIGNVLSGVLFPLIPRPSAENAYRAIIVAEFVGGEQHYG